MLAEPATRSKTSQTQHIDKREEREIETLPEIRFAREALDQSQKSQSGPQILVVEAAEKGEPERSVGSVWAEIDKAWQVAGMSLAWKRTDRRGEYVNRTLNQLIKTGELFAERRR